jgi:hypothetical protein
LSVVAQARQSFPVHLHFQKCKVKATFQTLAGVPTVLILAATDGYANAYRDEASFQQVARDVWSLLGDEGKVGAKLE